jgi:AcrR family transcriptional regulator
MRRRAEALGVTSTAPYRHVPTEDDVLASAVDRIFGACRCLSRVTTGAQTCAR